MEEKYYKKLYEDVVAQAKYGLKDGLYLSRSAKDVTEFLFPQLKETEDEKVKRELTTFLINYNNGVCTRPSKDKIDSWIKWIEKQGEQKPCMIQWNGNNLKEIVEFTGESPKFNDWFKTWEEYENYVYAHNNIFKLFNEDGSHFEVPVGAWIVKTLDGYNIPSRFKFIQKPAWSEEDEDALDIAIRIIQNGGNDCAGILDSNKALRWLKSIKDKVQPQPKQEWSEYDKIQLDEAIQMIEANGDWIRSEDAVKKVSNWLKSLKPNHWKPSDEQIKAIKYFIDFHRPQANASTEGWNEFKHLESLYNELKNL